MCIALVWTPHTEFWRSADASHVCQSEERYNCKAKTKSCRRSIIKLAASDSASLDCKEPRNITIRYDRGFGKVGNPAPWNRAYYENLVRRRSGASEARRLAQQQLSAPLRRRVSLFHTLNQHLLRALKPARGQCTTLFRSSTALHSSNLEHRIQHAPTLSTAEKALIRRRTL
ncbi:hypothetical protein PHSY_007070 [Pseudozyma hubeiensis SY62]|uniref:Uncharacterized protein n=1 Tax=Pseudozyma hubeiensis (strain SY62) TaxID=1305764 RepID=R9PDM0_PSEHS|nr:hypothetical protein PHSY_007070 [Pseudozyma hubeiensis SY62]GAC99469.1 hypothetical protein PHSY_007070 [Pseudozyma hubeiensis SY62]